MQLKSKTPQNHRAPCCGNGLQALHTQQGLINVLQAILYTYYTATNVAMCACWLLVAHFMKSTKRMHTKQERSIKHCGVTMKRTSWLKRYYAQQSAIAKQVNCKEK
eukprot:6247-Heterococcus_DN1.PRE.1